MNYSCGLGPHCNGCLCSTCDNDCCTVDLPDQADIASGNCWTDECNEVKSKGKSIPEALFNRLILHLKANLSDMAAVNTLIQDPRCMCCGTRYTCSKCKLQMGHHGYTLMERENAELLEELEKI